MKPVGTSQQQVQHPLYDASGTITAGGTAQLVLARSLSRSYFFFQNLSSGPMYLEFGAARATSTISGGIVNSISVANAGFNYTKPPLVRFFGGGQPQGGNPSYVGLSQPEAPAPPHPAQAHAIMTGSAPNLSVSSFVIDDPGLNYLIAPMVFLLNSDLDPNGCAVPSITSGRLVPASQFVEFTVSCTTDQVAVFGATTGQSFTCKYMD